MQNFELKNKQIHNSFLKIKKENPGKVAKKLNLSWSNWGFGIEPLAVSVKRLADNDIRFIELHGNHYGPDLGYKPSETRMILDDHGVSCAGICGMFSRENDLSINCGVTRQNALASGFCGSLLSRIALTSQSRCVQHFCLAKAPTLFR